MKVPLLVVLATGCLPPAGPPPDRYDDGYDDGGWMGSGGDPIFGCRQDTECGAQVCARDGECYPASGIRLVTTTWTVRGEPASATTCAAHPDLAIRFQASNGASFGFAPVPCRIGKFTIDKLPLAYTRVELGVENGGLATSAAIASAGDTIIDLR